MAGTNKYNKLTVSGALAFIIVLLGLTVIPLFPGRALAADYSVQWNGGSTKAGANAPPMTTAQISTALQSGGKWIDNEHIDLTAAGTTIHFVDTSPCPQDGSASCTFNPTNYGCPGTSMDIQIGPISNGQDQGHRWLQLTAVKAGSGSNNCQEVITANGGSNELPLNLANATSAATPSTTTASATQHDPNATCETDGDPLSWILCPVFNGVADFSDWLFKEVVQPELITTPISTNSSDPSYEIWSSFRVYGDIFLIIALLVVVFGQSIGGGLIDAYTAKKVLPRLLGAAILINLSIYIVAGLVDITNIIGGGIGQLMTAPLGSSGAFNIKVSGIQGLGIVGLTGTAVIGTFLAGVLGLLVGVKFLAFIGLFLVMPAFFGILAAFITLIARKAIILALVLVSPVAFALWCLPNTEKYFKKWWDFLIEALMVYPIVIVFFSVADILSVTVMKANHVDGSNLSAAGSSVIAAIIAFLLQFLPLLFIPFAFKIAGGTIGRMHEMLSTGHKRLQEGIKGNVNDPNSLRNQVKKGLIADATRRQYNVIRSGEGLRASAWQRRRARFAKNRGVFGDVNSRMSRLTKEAQEREEQESASGYDGYRYAANWFSFGAGQALPAGLTDGGVAIAPGTVAAQEMFFDSKGRRISEMMARTSEAQHGRDEHESMRNLEYTLRKAQTDEDLANRRRAFEAAAVRNNWSDIDIADAHARSTFEHKDKFSSEWYSTPQARRDAQGRLVGIGWDDVANNRRNQNNQVQELHKTRESFKLSSVRGADLRSWDTRRNEIQERLDTGYAPTAPAAAEAWNRDLEFYAETNELLDQMVHQGIVTREGEEGPVQAGGSTAESAGILKTLVKNRRYDTTSMRSGTATGVPAAPGGTPVPEHTYSVNQRLIYHRESADRAARAIKGGASVDDVVNGSVPGYTGPIARAVVTGDADRSVIPK